MSAKAAVSCRRRRYVICSRRCVELATSPAQAISGMIISSATTRKVLRHRICGWHQNNVSARGGSTASCRPCVMLTILLAMRMSSAASIRPIHSPLSASSCSNGRPSIAAHLPIFDILQPTPHDFPSPMTFAVVIDGDRIMIAC